MSVRGATGVSEAPDLWSARLRLPDSQTLPSVPQIEGGRTNSVSVARTISTEFQFGSIRHALGRFVGGHTCPLDVSHSQTVRVSQSSSRRSTYQFETEI